MKIIESSVEPIQTTQNPLELIERSGRNCYQSEPQEGVTPADFCRRLIRRGHSSVLEHATSTFKIVTDRGIMAELTRHRTGIAYSVQSTRYYADTEGISVIRPSMLPDCANDLWRESCQTAEYAYLGMLGLGVKPEDARSVLPTCTATSIIVTANWAEWRHVLRLRTAKAAHPDMRAVMGMVREWFNQNYPVIVEDTP